MWGVAIFMLVAGCSGDDREVAPWPTPAGDASWPTTDWIVQNPVEQGMDESVLSRAKDYAFQPGKNTQGVVVVRRGVLVAEWYGGGADAGSWAASWSVGKSFASALIGIAIGQGIIPGVEVSLAKYFPQWRGTDKAGITLRDVLTMASGLAWVEDYNPAAFGSSDIIRLGLAERDQLAYAANREMARQPGSRFHYSSGDTLLLSGVLEAATGMKAGDFAVQALFSPLGINSVDWWTDASGHTLTYCCVDMTSQDFARFGLLYQRQGYWRNKQVVPAGWVADSTSPSRSFRGYGYQWWLSGRTNRRLPADTFAAVGYDGQYVYVIPSLELVVVRNGRYVKYSGRPVADPSLFARYPAGGLIPNLGTVPPDEWKDTEFLTPIIDSITGG
ncbi:MAG: serine hydrolase [Nitrospirae bacterium]|nr:serine hydrolase [Nitrospirota bacterium]